MPWASQAQRRKFYATPSLRKYIPEFNAATPKGAKLPERVPQRRHRNRRRRGAGRYANLSRTVMK